MRSRRRVALSALTALVLGLAGTGCSQPVERDDSIVASVANTSAMFPSETLSDWVSYFDQVSRFVVVDERKLPLGAHEREHGEGLVDREVTVEIEETMWVRDGAERLTGSTTYETAGWELVDNETRLIAFGGVRVEVGQQYVAAFVYSYPNRSDTAMRWGPIPATVMPVGDDSTPDEVVVRGTVVGVGHEALVDQTSEEIARILAQTEPDPRAAAHFDQDPLTRYSLVALSEWPDRPGMAKAIGDQFALGYVRTDDLEAELAREDPENIPLYSRPGESVHGTFTPGEGMLARDHQ